MPPRKLKPPRDKSGKHRKRCEELAGELGQDVDEVWRQFEFMACALEFEQKLPRAYAETAAIRFVVEMFDKRGRQNPD